VRKRGWSPSAGGCCNSAGDIITIKGSPGSKVKRIVNALEMRFPGKTAHEKAAV
jgi:hypothetical protein